MKTYNVQHNIGKAKYCVNFHDGLSKNKDGSNFVGLRIFSNKKKLALYLSELKKNGYIQN